MKPPYPVRRIHGSGSEEEHKTMKQTCHFDYGDSFFCKYMFIELLWLWWNKPDKPASGILKPNVSTAVGHKGPDKQCSERRAHH